MEGHGFHEVGFTPDLKSCRQVGWVTLPFKILPADRRVESVWMADVSDVFGKGQSVDGGVVYWILSQLGM